MSKSEQLIEQEGRYGVDEEVCFHFPLDSDDFFIDVISWIVAFVQKNKDDPRRHTKQNELLIKYKAPRSNLA